MPSSDDPRSRGLHRYLDAVDAATQAESLLIADLSAGDVIDIETYNHLYTFILEDPEKGTAEAMSNGKKIVEPTAATITGSLLGAGSSIMTGRVCIGYSLEVYAGGRRLEFSPTKRVAVNGVTVLPRPGKGTAN